jgi:hypothetical protein
MTSLLDVMYYYALFNYDRDNTFDSFHNSSEDDDDRVERLSKEDVALIPEMTYQHPISEAEASVTITHPINPQEPPPLAAAEMVSTSSTRTTYSSNSAGKNKVAAAAAPTCAICISSCNEGDILKILPNCHHIFHIDCISQWLTEHSNLCPLCRLPVVVCKEEGYANKNKRMRSYLVGLGNSSLFCEPTCSIQ